VHRLAVSANPIYLPEGGKACYLPVFGIRAAHVSRTISFPPLSYRLPRFSSSVTRHVCSRSGSGWEEQTTGDGLGGGKKQTAVAAGRQRWSRLVGVGVGRTEVRVSSFWVVEVVEVSGGDGDNGGSGGVRVRVRVPGGLQCSLDHERGGGSGSAGGQAVAAEARRHGRAVDRAG
jgi:hypothetical protein